MRFRDLIFDLDGTLVDSLAGIEASARHAVALCTPERALPPMRAVIGPPIRTMFGRLWPELSAASLDALVLAFRSHYDTVGCVASPLYPDVRETLASLHRAGARMFVLTNKPALPVRLILEQHAIHHFFRAVISPDSATPPFLRKVDGAEHLRAEFDLKPASTIIVGDGVDDQEAAEACGFCFAIAGYGYGGAASAGPSNRFSTLKTFSDIADFVL